MSGEMLDRKRSEAIAYYDMGRYDQAEQALKEVLAADPEDVFTSYLLANCCYMLDKYDQAEKICRDIVTSYLEEDVFRLMGKICREKKEYRRAEEFFLQSLERNPQSPDTLAEYAFLLLTCGYHKKAGEVMQEAERIDPEDSVVLHYKFYFKHAHGSKKEEEIAVEQYMEGTADEVQKLVKLGLMDYKNNRFKSAREFFRQAFLLEPTNEYILGMLEELDRINHFIFFPNRLNSRMHPVVRFAGVPLAIVVVFSVLAAFESTAAFVFMGAAFIGIMVLNIWSWLSGPIYKFLNKGE